MMLRSLVVLPAHRGMGMGRSLLSGLIAQAHSWGATEAWLLTTNAASFFIIHGFKIAS